MIEVEDLRPIALFAGVTDEQLTSLAAAGTEVRVERGVEVFHEGDPADSWFVLVDGSVELLRHVGHELMTVARMDRPGQWAGGFRAWDEHGVYLATGIGAQEGRLLQVPAPELRRLTDAWFPLGGHLIAGLFTTARSIEATARQRESLVTLGRLAAGLAHELNNPAAAATRAVDELDSAARALQTSLRQLAAAGLTPERFLAVEGLRAGLLGSGALGPLQLADREEVLAEWLDDHHVARSWLLAPALAAAGADVAWCEAAAAELGGPALEPGLEWVANSITLGTLVAELKQSTGRVSDVVGAMKSYSQMDRASLQHVDVTEGLENTLVLLDHKIADGLDVVRSYESDLPQIEAYPAELNQVWTNLIDNALDAMDGAGTLGISARKDGQELVVVEISDTGPGMPPDVAARAFEPFFTTKSAAGNTGLGLEIARRIVEERHGGIVGIESRPGRTVVRVSLSSRLRRRS